MSTTNATSAGAKSPPVSPQRMKECLASATVWAGVSGNPGLGQYADRMQWRANALALGAAMLAAATSLSVWTTLTEEPSGGAQLAVAGVALLGAALATLLRVMNYAESAGAARALVSQYSAVYGELRDLLALPAAERDAYESTIRATVQRFERVKEQKDQLVPRPKKRDAEQRS
jgi:hypothetical protein